MAAQRPSAALVPLLLMLLAAAALRLDAHPPLPNHPLGGPARVSSRMDAFVPDVTSSPPRPASRHRSLAALPPASPRRRCGGALLHATSASAVAPPCTWRAVWLADRPRDEPVKGVSPEAACFAGEAADAASAGEAIASGDAVLLLPNMVGADELAKLCTTAVEYALQVESARNASGLDPIGRSRLPSVAAAARAAVSNVSCAAPLPRHADEIMERILRRVMEAVDECLPSVVDRLFGRGAESMCMCMCMCMCVCVGW